MVTERTIINGLIIGAGIIFVPFLISSTLTVDYAPALFLGALIAFVWGFFFLKEKLCISPLIAAFFTGSLNFLPLPLKATHVFSILLIGYYITGYVVIRQKRIKLGKTMFLWPILIVTSILIYHNHSLSVAAVGGETEGGKPAILIYIITLAYFCGINITTPSVRFLGRVPFYCVVAAIVSSIPFILTTYIPSLAPILFYITDSVNVNAYAATQATATDTNSEGVIGRLAILGPLGGCLQLYLLCHYPITTWLRPGRWWVLALSLICGLFEVASGYRSYIFGYVWFIMIGTWCYYSWRAFILPASLFIAAFMLLIASSNDLIRLPTNKLPLIAQRSLSFLPGEWDDDAIESAKSSNDFRQGIHDVYISDYLRKSPLLGNGFGINTKEYDALNAALSRGEGGRDNGYLVSKTYIEGKLFHTGWISVYDCVGIIGSVAFYALAFNVIGAAAHFIIGPRADRRSPLFPLYVWIMCSTAGMMIGFFTVYGDFKDDFPLLCIYAMVLSHLFDIENVTEVPVPLADRKGQGEFSRLGGAYSGYPSKR